MTALAPLPSSPCSVLPPLVPALGTLVEGGHGFVGRADLDLHEVGARAGAAGALGVNLVYVFPGLLASEHVVHFFPLQLHLLLELLVEHEDVGARLAEEAEVRYSFLDEQQVRAGRAEEHRGLLGSETVLI